MSFKSYLVLLNTFKYHHTETLVIFTIFVPMFKLTINGKNYGKNWFLVNFLFLPPSLWVKLCDGFATLYRGETGERGVGGGGLLNRLLKITIILCHWLSEIFQKNKKNEVLHMLFQITQICFNEPDYVTLHSIMNIMTENGAKMTHKMTQ